MLLAYEEALWPTKIGDKSCQSSVFSTGYLFSDHYIFFSKDLTRNPTGQQSMTCDLF